MCWGPAHADPLFFCVVSDIDVLSIEWDIEIRLIIIFEATKSVKERL